MTLTNTLPPVTQVPKQESVIYSDTQALLRIQQALGSYQRVLSTALEAHQGAPHETLEAVRIGVLAMDDYLTMPAVTPSMESFQGTQISLEALSDNIKAVARAVKEAILRLFEFLRKVWQSTGAELTVLKTRITALHKQISGLVGSQPKANKVTVQGINRIVTDGRVTLTGRRSMDEIRKTAEFLHVDYPALLKTMIQKLADVQRKHAARYDNIQKEMDGVTPQSLLKSKIYSHETLDAAEVEKEFITAVKARVGDVLLPGNKQLVVNTDGLERGNDSIANRIRFDVVKAREVESNITDLAVLTPPEMTTLVTRLDGLVDYMIANSAYQRQYDAIQDHLLKEVDRIAAASGDDTMRRGTEQRLQRISVLVTQPLNGFNHYIVDTISAYLGIVRFHAGQYAEVA